MGSRVKGRRFSSMIGIGSFIPNEGMEYNILRIECLCI
jgi:hypothetical protein